MALKIYSDISLLHHNTFGMNVKAPVLYEVHTEEEIREALEYENKTGRTAPLVLGGGSNVLFTKDLSCAVIHVKAGGIEVVNENEEHIFLKAGAGEVWHQFVLHCINQNLGGVENLSLIPGFVGASPMQNIGAYGVEVKDVLHEVHTIERSTGKVVVFPARDCALGYRESIFKRKYKGQFIITAAVFRLNKNAVVNTSYGAIQQELEKMNVHTPSVRDVSNAVIHIRRSKLPDPAQIGNAGSFFKNPFISTGQFIDLKKNYPNIPGYDLKNGMYKIAAGWLIEQCGWKGVRKGDAGCYEKQSLVLVNFGQATGNDILSLCHQIMETVQHKFSITLEPEVNIIN